MKKYLYITAAVSAAPLMALAQVGGATAATGAGNSVGQQITRFLAFINNALKILIPTLIGIAIAVFLWGVLRYIFAKEGAAQKEARQYMLWGIIAIAVMVSVWGLVAILQGLVGINSSGVPQAPGIPGRL